MKLNTTSLATCISACMLLGLTACGNDSKPVDPKPPVVKPEPKSLEITITTQGVVETFKSLSFTAKASNTTNDVSYSWNFGDESSATGANVKHTYGKAGDYTVVLTATDMKTKKTVTTKKKVTVTAKASSNKTSILVKVEDSPVEGATVHVNGKAQTTNKRGFAKYEAVNSMDKALVSVSLDGHITQSIQLEPSNKPSESRSINISSLKKQNPMQAITDISSTNTLKQGNMTVTFEKDSFVTDDGKAVTGKADVSITKWDPTDISDMYRFLGDGVAIDSNGEYGQLQSYGAMTVNFTQNGKKLQLAPGKYADISMPLPLAKDYDGSDMKVGDTIPMWHFAESTGAWIQEADLMGTIVADADGNLKLEAQVSHFTTWNWDKKTPEPTDTMVVKCQLATGEAVGCVATGFVTYLNGGMRRFGRKTVPLEGRKVFDAFDSKTQKMMFEAYYHDTESWIMYTGMEQVFDAKNKSLTIMLDKSHSIEPVIPKADYLKVKCGYFKTREATTRELDKTCTGKAAIIYTNQDGSRKTVKHTWEADQNTFAKIPLLKNKPIYYISIINDTYYHDATKSCYPKSHHFWHINDNSIGIMETDIIPVRALNYSNHFNGAYKDKARCIKESYSKAYIIDPKWRF